MKKISLILIILLYISFALFTQDDPINLTLPKISEGNVFNDSYYYGPISIESSYEGEMSFSSTNKEAYYSLDGGTTWSPADMNQTSFIKYRTITNARNQCEIIDCGDNGFISFYAEFRLVDQQKEYNIYCQKYDKESNPVGQRVKVNDVPVLAEDKYNYSGKYKYFDVTQMTDNQIVIVWNSKVDDDYCLVGRRFTDDCNAAGDYFEISVLDKECYSLNTVNLTDRGFVVLWNNRGSDSKYSSYFKIFDQDNVPLSISMVIESSSDETYYLINLSNGGFLAYKNVNVNEIEGKIYDKLGLVIDGSFILSLLSSPEQINDENVYLGINPVKLMETSTGYAVSYIVHSVNNYYIVLQRFDSDKNEIGEKSVLYTSPGRIVGDVISFDDSGFIVPVFDGSQNKLLLYKYDQDLSLSYENVLSDYTLNQDIYLDSITIQKAKDNNINLNLFTMNVSTPPGFDNIKAIAAGPYHTVTLKENGTVVAWGNNSNGECNVPAGLGNVKAIAAGEYHTVTLKEDGTVVAWGYNSHGECNVPAGLSNVKAIVAGSFHTVALKEDGTVVAWGENSYGECDIPAGLSNVRAIAAGNHYTIALKEDGTVVAWGLNNIGQCNVPTGLSNVRAIATGGSHTVALKEDGSVIAWGYNSYGQCNVPTGLSNVRAIAAGWVHTIALKEDGIVVAWGYNSYGECDIPAGLNNVKTIAAGNHYTIALKEDATVVAWGYNDYGQCNVPSNFVFKTIISSDFYIIGVIGLDIPYYHIVALTEDGTVVAWGKNLYGECNVPAGLSNVKAIAAGWHYTVILKEDGTVVAWGENSYGECNVPAGLSNVMAIAVGISHTVALKEDGTVVAWGRNNEGQCNVPTGLSNIKAITAGGNHTVALTEDGTVVAWGNNEHGQCNVPAGLSNVKAIAAGWYHTIVLKEDGTIVAWGNNNKGQCNVPTGLSNVMAIAAGISHTVVLKEDGTAVAWGDNYFGQCNVPAGLSNVKAITAGGHTIALKEDGMIISVGDYNCFIPGPQRYEKFSSGSTHTIALSKDNKLYAWGYNNNGQCDILEDLIDVKSMAAGGTHSIVLKEDGSLVAWGNNEKGQCTIPSGLTDVKEVSAGNEHTLALKDDGYVLAWGDNERGQCNVPSGLTSARAISAGDYYSVALKEDGTVIAWGDNEKGQCDVPSELGNVKEISAGGEHTGALTESGDVYAWGDNEYGQCDVPAGLYNIQAISAGNYHTVAIKEDGTVIAWGRNDYGQCDVPAWLTDVVAIGTGDNYTVALKANGTIVSWGYYYYGEYYDQTSYIFNDNRVISAKNLDPQEDITIQFKLYNPDTDTTYYSEKRDYIYANPDDGKEGSIDYDDCITNQNTAVIKINLPEGKYKSIQLYQRYAIYYDGIISGFDEWMPYGTQSTMTTEETVQLYDGMAYQYKWIVTNSAEIQYEYTSDNIIRCDQSPPELLITGESLEKGILTLTLNISDEASGIDQLTYQLNSNASVSFSGNEVSVTLDDGSNHVIIEAVDYAGNSSTKHLFKNNEYIVPEIIIYGIEEGALYGDEVTFSYYTTQELTDIVITLDDVVLTFVNDEYKLDFTDKDEGLHTLKITGNDSDDNEISKSVSFSIEHSLLSLLLNSPQSREYGQKNITIDYWSNEPLKRVFYTLNGGPETESLELTDLTDGNYTLVVTGESENGKTANASVNFTVKEAFPTLNIIQPAMNEVYSSNTIEVVFDSNSPVTYLVGDLSGDITSGDTIILGDDGVYDLTLTAEHPLTNNILKKTITFAVDSLLPEVEILTPANGIYGYRDIPIDYTANKIITNIKMYLDGEEVSLLNDLDIGDHEFRFTAEDMAGRKIEKVVNFTIATLRIIKPEENEKIISNDLYPTINLQYESSGNFQTLTHSMDGGDERLITEDPGVDIPIKTTPGYHNLSLKGHINEFKIEDSVGFQAGKKNISVNKSSIDYEYTESTTPDLYDVTVTLEIHNTGDVDLLETIPVRFDYISLSGDVETQFIDFDPLDVGDSSKITLTPFQASFGYTFTVTIDPDNTLESEYKDDNVHSITFQTGQITGITNGFPDDNVYLQDVSFLNIFTVDTAGPVAYVEFRTNSVIFVDDTPENGFNSYVDMGLLSTDKNYVQVVAYGENGVVLDSFNYYVNMKRVDERLGKLVFPWGYFASTNTVLSSLDTANLSLLSENSAGSRVIMGDIVPKELLQLQLVTMHNALTNKAGIIPVIDDEQRVIYQIVTKVSSGEDDNAVNLDLTDIPVLGGNYELPDGNDFIIIITIDPTRISVVVTGVILIDGSDSEGYLGEINRLYNEAYESLQEIIDDVNDIIDSLDNEEVVIRLLNDISLENIGIPIDYFSFGNLFFIHYDFLGAIPIDIEGDNKDEDLDQEEKENDDLHIKNILGAYFTGFIDISVFGEFYVKKPVIQISYLIEAEVSYVTDEDDLLDITAQASFALDIDTTIHAGTPGALIVLTGVFGISIFKFCLPPLAFGVFTGVLRPQNFHIPMHSDIDANFTLTDGVFTVTPFHFSLHKYISHSSKLFSGSAVAATAHIPVFDFGLLGGLFVTIGASGDAKVKIYIKIKGNLDIDTVAGFDEDFNFKFDYFYYAWGKVHLKVRYRYKIFIHIFGIPILVYDSDWITAYNDYIVPKITVGNPYSQSQVDQLIEDRTIILEIPDEIPIP